MPRVIRSPAKGAIVQPVMHAHQHTAAAASTPARPASSSSSAAVASAVGAASGDFLYCFQLQPLCPLSYSAANDWLLRQPAGTLSLAPPSAAEFIRSQKRSQAAATAAANASDSGAIAEVPQFDELDDADSSQLSLDPAALGAFDLAHGGSPALGAAPGGSERSDAIAAAAGAPGLPSVSVSVHTGTTQAKAAQQGAKANAAGGSAQQLSLESFAGRESRGTPAASPSRSHDAHSNVGASDRRCDEAAGGSAGADAVARSALPAAVSKRKQAKDVFSFPSQSSASRSDSQLSSQSTQPDAAPQLAAAAAAGVVASCTTVPPSFTLPSRRPGAHEVIVIDGDEPASQVHLAPTPTPSPPPSVRIPASTPPSSASIPAGAVALPPTFPATGLTASTRSLNPSAPFTLDPHIVLPSLAQLHSSKDTAVHTLHVMDFEMKDMDERLEGINARAQPAAHGGDDQAPMSMSSDEHEHEHEDEHEDDSHPDPIVASQQHRPVSQSQSLGGTPPLAQREAGYERLRAPPAAHSTIVTSSSKSDEPVAAMPAAASLGYAVNIASLHHGSLAHESQLPVHVVSQQIDSPSQTSASPAPQASPSHLPPFADHPHSRGASFASSLMIDTPPLQAHNTASSFCGLAPASGTPLQLQLSATPQLSVPPFAGAATMAVSAVSSSASFSSPSGSAAPSAASASVHASSMQLRLEVSPAPSPAAAAQPASPTTSSLPPSPSLSPSLSPPLSPALSEPLHADTNASYVDLASEPAMASMSLELNFDDDDQDMMMQAEEAAPAEGMQVEAAVPVQPRQADHEMRDVERAAEPASSIQAPVLPPLAVDAAAMEGVAESAHSPAALHHGTIPYSATGEGDASQQQPRALAATPRKPSIVSLPTADSAAATQVLKLSVSPARSPISHAAVVAAGGRAHSVADDVCSATQQLVSPIKSVSSPAATKPHSALRSPIKRVAHAKAAKQLQFGEQGRAASVARSSNAVSMSDAAAGGGSSVDAAGATSSSSGAAAAAAAAAAAPDLAAASLLVANMDSLSPCTPTPCRSFDDSSHQPSFDSTPAAGPAHASLAALLQSHPDDPSHVGVVSQSQSSAAAAVAQEPTAVKTAAALNRALDDSAAPHEGVAVAPSTSDYPAVPAAWSRARKPAGEEAVDVDAEDRRTPAPFVPAVGVSSDHKRRGKSFNKQPKSTAVRSSEGGLLVDAAAAAAASAAPRPMLSVAASKPVPISLLSESQAEESQAEFSVDPFRRARAKKEAQAADAKSRRIRAEPPVELIVAKAELGLETQDDLSPHSSPTQSPPKPMAAAAAAAAAPRLTVSLAEAPVIPPAPVATTEPAAPKEASAAHVSPQLKPSTTAPMAAEVSPVAAAATRAAKVPSPSNTSARNNTASPVGGAAAAAASRAVSPFSSMPASPRTPHHYGSSRKLIIHTLVKRPSPDGKRESPRLSPSAAAVAARQTENSASPTGYPPGVSDKKATSSAEGTAATRAKPTSLSAILEESSSNASAFTLGPSRVDSMRKTSAGPSAPTPTPAPAPAPAPAAIPIAAPDDQVAPMEIDGVDSTPTSTASLPSSMLHAPPAAEAAAAAAPSRPHASLDVEMSSAAASSASAARAPSGATPSAPSSAESVSPPAAASASASASAPLRAASTRKRSRGTISSSADSPSASPVEDAEPTSQGSTSSGGGGGKRAKRSPIHVTAVFKSASTRAASPAHPTPSASAAASAASSSAAASAGPAAALAAAPSPSPPTGKQLRSSLMKGTLFLITGVSKHHANDAAKQTRLIQQCGGRCVESLDELPPPSDATLRSPQIIVLASAPKRTMKFMFSLARGLPPLQPGWLESCVAATEVVVPSDAQLVPLKEEDGHVSKYPAAWLQSLRERRFLHPLPMHKRILHGVRIAVCAPPNTVAEVAVVCREAGATVWSCDTDKEEWTAWSSAEADGAAAADRAEGGAAAAAASAVASTPRASSRRAASKDAAGSSSSGAAPVVRPSRVDMVLADKAESVTAWIKRSLSETAGSAAATAAASSRGKSKAKSLPPIVSVRFLIQCLMQQKRLSDKEREEFIL